MLAVVILGSWLLPATRAWWDALDESAFRLLNGTLASGQAWQTFWAWANWRLADAVPAVVILTLLGWWLAEGGRDHLARRIGSLATFAIALMLVRDLTDFLLEDVIVWTRRSPTLLLPDVQLLSELVPAVDAKDASRKSFPGDHGFAFLAVVTFLWFHVGRRRGLITMACLLPFMLPRLVGGAHWLTDILVGSVFMALLSLSWWFATPLSALATDLAQALIRRVLAALHLGPSRRKTRTHTT